jgi:hypothetical protein
MLREALIGWVDSKAYGLKAAPGDPYRVARRLAGQAYLEVQDLMGQAIRGEFKVELDSPPGS